MKSLSMIRSQLDSIKQRVPSIITKGVVVKEGSPWFSGSIKPKYHPNFAKVAGEVGALDKHTTVIGLGGVVIIDVDDTPMFEEHFPELLDTLEGNTPQYLSRNKKGQHYLVKMKNAPTQACKKIKVGNIHVFDVLNGKQAAWCRHPIQNVDAELVEVDFEAFAAPTKPQSSPALETEENDSEDLPPVPSPTSVTSLPCEVMEFIEERFSSCSVKVKEMSHAFVIDLGKSDEGRYCPHAGRCHSKNNTYLTFSKKTQTLAHKCHSCVDWKQKIKQFKKVDLTELTDYKLAKLFVEQFGTEFIYDGDVVYHYNGALWEQDESNKHLLHYLNEKFYSYLRKAYYENDGMEDDKGATFKAIRGIQQARKKEDLLKELKPLLHRNVEFDDQWFIVQFNNKVFDLQTMEFKECSPEYYTSKSMGYDVEERDAEKEAWFMENVVERIFPDEDDRKTYLQYIATALEGRTLEKMMIARGAGRNGKGVINELMLSTMGEYGHQCDANLFLGKVRDGPNPALASLGGKRFVVFSEPNKDSYLNASMIKLVTGTERVSARMLYSNKTTTKLQLTLVEETNARVRIDHVDEALGKRLGEVLFISTFSNDPELVGRPNVHPCNVFFKSKEFKRQYRMTLVWILIDYYKQYKEQGYELFVGEETKQRTKEYLDDNNDLYGWFCEEYDKTGDDNDLVKMKIVYQNFKMSVYWDNFTKKEKRTMTFKRFQQDLRENMRLKHYCSKKGDRPYVNGVQHIAPFVFGWKKRETTIGYCDEDSDA